MSAPDGDEIDPLDAFMSTLAHEPGGRPSDGGRNTAAPGDVSLRESLALRRGARPRGSERLGDATARATVPPGGDSDCDEDMGRGRAGGGMSAGLGSRAAARTGVTGVAVGAGAGASAPAEGVTGTSSDGPAGAGGGAASAGRGMGCRLPPQQQLAAAQAASAAVDWVGSVQENVRSAEAQSMEHKTRVLVALVAKDPVLFLERYGKHLTAEQLGWFSGCGYEASFHVARLREALARRGTGSGASVDPVVRNRRFVKAMQLQEAGEYFGSDAIKERAPALHEQILGQFTQPSSTPVSFSAMLMKSAQRRPRTPDSEVDSDEEAGDDASGAGAGEGAAAGAGAGGDAGAGGGGGTRPGGVDDPAFEHMSPQDEHDQLRRLQLLMVRRFMDGRDDNYFDYASVDNDASLDTCAEANADMEEAYFRA